MRSLVSAAIIVAFVYICTTDIAARAPVPEVVGKEELAAPAVDFAKAKSDKKLASQILVDRKASRKNLNQIALAFHVYHEAQNHLPVDIVDKDGKALLSWRVAILPHLPDGEKLFKEFKLDESWDSRHNRKLLEKMPDIYRSPRVKLNGKGNTVYQVFTGPNAVFGRTNPLRLTNIPDGTSNTIMAIESGTATPWTKPGGIPFDRKKGMPDFSKAYGNKPLAVLCDGSSTLLDLDIIKTDTFKNAIDPAEGIPLGQDWNDGTQER